MSRVLFIPDMHHPWAHPMALDLLMRTRDQYQCDRVVCLGDEIDAQSFSVKFTANPDMPSPSDELKYAIDDLQPFYKEFPNVEVMESNHGMRIFKKARLCGLPSAVLKGYSGILEYPPGWTFLPSIEIDGIYISHGDSFNKNSWRTGHEKLKQSIAIGHLHSGAGVIYSQNRKRKYLCANFGCLINPSAIAFEYGKHIMDKPVLGCGVILDGEEAYFVPMK